MPGGQFVDGRVDLRGANAVPPGQGGQPGQAPAGFVMHERGGKPVGEDRSGRRPAARVPAFLVTEHGGHFAQRRETGAIALPSADSGGAASRARPGPNPPGPACMDTMRLAN